MRFLLVYEGSETLDRPTRGQSSSSCDPTKVVGGGRSRRYKKILIIKNSLSIKQEKSRKEQYTTIFRNPIEITYLTKKI